MTNFTSSGRPGAGTGVDERFRMEATRALLQFRDSQEDGELNIEFTGESRPGTPEERENRGEHCSFCCLAAITFPATLTNVERKFVHHICSRFGLVSKSSGCV